jgi:hypothetical protein
MSQSRYPERARLLDVVQGAGLKKSGLVADAILPPVQTGANFFEWIDWSTTDLRDGIFDNMKVANDIIGCYGSPKEIDPSSFKLVQGRTTDKALSMVLKECGPATCAPLPFDIQAAKTLELVDKLLLSREQRVISAVTNETIYAAPTSQDPTAADTAEGVVFDLKNAGAAGPTGLNNTIYDLLKYFQGIQEENFSTGMRNIAVMRRKHFNALLRHPSFKPGGCAIPPLAAEAEVAALIGVDRIVIADAAINKALANANFNLDAIWGEYILLTKSIQMATPESQARGFGFSAYTSPLTNRIYFDDKVGKDGSDIQVVSHDYTEVIADIKSATLIKV